MNAVSADVVKILRLHTDDDGFVWYGDDTQLAVNTYLEPSDFFGSDVFGVGLEQVKCVRMLGTKNNAPLIISLSSDRCRDRTLLQRQRVQLCSPAMLATERLRNDPEAVLQHLWQPSYSSTLHGSWHDLTDADYCTYAMIANMPTEPHIPVPEIVHRIAKYHPAWPAFSFVNTLDPDAACRTICAIVDPRWYRHPFHPNRATRLYSYLGLTPANMSAFCGIGSPDRHHERAMWAVRTWYNRRFILPTHHHGPADFLWLTFKDTPDKAKGLLKGTQRLVRLVMSVWMYAVLTPAHPDARFLASEFFKNPEEIAAFEQHRMQKK